MNILISLVIGGLLSIGGFFVGQHQAPVAPAPAASFGTFLPVEGVPYTIAKTVLPTDNTITLSSFNTPDGRALTMSNFGYIGYATIDPNNLSRLESVSFTGITPNANGTVTLTGVLRGLDFVSPYAASTNLEQTHLVGASFILSNTAGFYGNEFLFANNNGTSSATLVFGSTTMPRYDQEPSNAMWSTATGTSFVSLNKLNATAIAGAANATTILNGIVQLATAAQAALGTTLGSTGASLVLPNSLATSTPGSNATTQVPITIGGKLAQAFLDLTQSFTFSGGVTSSATTTLAGSNVNSNALVINTVAYQWPSSQGSASTFLKNNGSGVLSWASSGSFLLATSTTNLAGSASTTLVKINIPANTLGTGNVVHVRIYGAEQTVENSDYLAFEAAYGNSTTTLVISNSSGSSITANGYIDFLLYENGTTNSQYAMLQVQAAGNGVAAASGIVGQSSATFSTDSTQIQQLMIVGKPGTGASVVRSDNYYVEVLR